MPDDLSCTLTQEPHRLRSVVTALIAAGTVRRMKPQGPHDHDGIAEHDVKAMAVSCIVGGTGPDGGSGA
ncbi:hypothetical protein [Variovorax saccharolyticus]|uniref:hypothetical protein n=1 Tax=Variovorax saccharolyticus TaxID=3053516 RepID=UPI0025760A4C|nr:hypothetical protein [Variovorax sp. J31P216]MDM0028323.1 hypothetical protein [Variovorax sp. J31P216]